MSQRNMTEEDAEEAHRLCGEFYLEVVKAYKERYTAVCSHCLALELIRLAGQMIHAGGYTLQDMSMEAPQAMAEGFHMNVALCEVPKSKLH